MREGGRGGVMAAFCCGVSGFVFFAQGRLVAQRSISRHVTMAYTAVFVIEYGQAGDIVIEHESAGVSDGCVRRGGDNLPNHDLVCFSIEAFDVLCSFSHFSNKWAYCFE